MNKVKKYPAYKDSGIEWIGEIPEHWEVIRSKYLWKEVNLRSQEGLEQLLSVSQYDGVRLANMESRSETLIDYKIVKKDNLVMNIMLVWLGGLGVSPFDGVVSPSYAVYKPLVKVDESYYHYLYRTSFYLDEFAKKSTGVVPSRWRLYSDAFGEIQSILPPLSEQKKIASFLDKKTGEIDKAIELKQKENELLKERRQVAINQAVTRGLHPNVTYKDSGIEWIGEIPEHWEVRRVKNFFKIGRGRVIAQTELDADGLYPVYSSQTLNNGVLGYINTYDYKERNITWTTDGANAGRVFLREGKYNCTNVCGTLSPIKKSINLTFHKYALDYIAHFHKRRDTNGYKIMNNEMANIQTILPPLSEQKEIAEYLEELDGKTNRLLDLNNQAIAKLKEYKQVVIDQAVRGQICLV